MMCKLDKIQQIGVVTFDENNGCLLNAERIEKGKISDNLLFFDLRVSAKEWKQALGMCYKKKGHYLLDVSHFDKEEGYWLCDFAKKNRLDISLSSSLRYEAWAARIKEWVMTGFLHKQGKIEIQCASECDVWKWVDLLYWWFEIGLDSWERTSQVWENAESSIKIQLKHGERNSLQILQEKWDVKWSDSDGLTLIGLNQERQIYLPKIEELIEQHCRCHEITHNNKWIVFPCEDCLMWLRNGELFERFLKSC